MRALILAAPFRSPLRCKSPGGVSASAHQGCILQTGCRAWLGRGPLGQEPGRRRALRQGGRRGAWPPYPSGDGEPDGGPPPGGSPQRAPSGGVRGGTPPGPGLGGPPGGPPGTPRGTKFCTFRWVFNKSPIRDKHGTGIFSVFCTFWDKNAGGYTPPPYGCGFGGAYPPPIGGVYGPPISVYICTATGPQNGHFGGCLGVPFWTPIGPLSGPPQKGPPGAPPGGPPRGPPRARGRPGGPPGPGAEISGFSAPPENPDFRAPRGPPRDPLFGPPFGPPFGTPTADYCGGGEAPPATPPSLGDRSFGMASARPVLFRPRSGRHPEADSQRRRMARPGSAIRGGA